MLHFFSLYTGDTNLVLLNLESSGMPTKDDIEGNYTSSETLHQHEGRHQYQGKGKERGNLREEPAASYRSTK